MTQPLLVPIADVARRAGLDWEDPAVAADVEDAIRDAMEDAAGYLGRALLPVQFTETGRCPVFDQYLGVWGYDLSEDPVIEVISATAELDQDDSETGLYTVVYTAGIDARDEQYGPIRRWVAAAAAYAHPSVTRRVGNKGRTVKSVSADGQSVSYDDRIPTSGVVTAGVPPQSTMDKWRIAGRRVYTRKGWTNPINY